MLKKFFAEPLIQFLLLGGLLFLLVYYVQNQNDLQRREITIDNDRIALMIVNYKTQTGILPTKVQLDAMIDDFIKEEIYYREAKKLGLDKDDEIIRRRLSQKFAFMQSDLAEIKEPTEKELQAYYNSNRSLFLQDADVSFSHVYFSTDNSTDSIARQRALVALQNLKKSSLQRAAEMGDRFPLQYDYASQSVLDIQQNFGNTAFADSLFQSPMHTWTGPVKSGYGWHLLYISNRNTTTEKPFESVKAEVKEKYLDAAKEEQNKHTYELLSKQYIINRAYLEVK
ncbi:MAG: peptidyl-prolyl cis-trans isomerase [Chitinophagaceae bacterium]|nr:peptidyl-prolyl cis-trans isomerase [Chitinophagaceae bacterium]